MRAHCPTCLRVEQWEGAERQVEMAGGSRLPALDPVLAAWNTCRAARDAGQVVVGRCVCGQPLIADQGDWEPWTLETPMGQFTVRADGQSGKNGEIETEHLQTRMDAALGPRIEIRPFLWLFQGTAMMSMVAPAFLWVCAVIAVIVFLTGLVNPPSLGFP